MKHKIKAYYNKLNFYRQKKQINLNRYRFKFTQPAKQNII